MLVKIGIVLMVGIMGGRVARFFKLPNVTGYLVAGLLIGPSFFKLIGEADIESMGFVNELALATIAFSIGSEFLLEDMLKVGKSIVVITLAEATGALLVVFSIMFFLFKQNFIFSMVVASMSAATAPAATIMVINQFRAHGPLTRTILPVVALDDVIGIIFFGVAMSMAKISAGTAEHSLWQIVSRPVIEIVGSVLLGFVFGALLSFMGKNARNKEELLASILAIIISASGLANLLGLSPLLTCIMIGATLVNLMHNSNRIFSIAEGFVPPVYLMFFTLAGASLDIKILSTVGLLGIAYIFARAGGKMLGAWLGAKAMDADEVVVKYLGLTLLPQGGVSIGLSIIVKQELPQYSVPIITIIMFSVLIYELVGPILSKIAIEKAGEINGLEKAKKQKKKKNENKKEKLVYN